MNEQSPGKPETSGWFEIRIEGHLEPRWLAWFGAEQLEKADDGTTILRGHMADQAQLHGLLQKIRDMGLPLVSLAHLDEYQPAPLKNP
jgi:hypothetical protein